MALTAARPKSGRPLQHPNPTRQNGFVAAVPSRAFRDGTGIFPVKLSHYLGSQAVANSLDIPDRRDYASAQLGWGSSGNLETGQTNENATAKRRTKQWNT